MRLFDNTIPLEMPTHVASDESKYSVGIPCVSKVSFKGFTEVMTREIDSRECAPSTDVDWNWGEQDSLANIPRKTCPTWIRALSDNGQQGDE